MLFELREYHCKPGMRDRWVALMEEVVIPFNVSKGAIVVASFVGESDDDTYIWIRRFNDEAHREQLYKDIYESDFWKNEVAPKTPDMLDRTLHRITRLMPTPKSAIR